MIVWLASYPRSGNTYFRAVLRHYFGRTSYSIYGDSLDIGVNPALAELVGHQPGDRQTLNLDEFRNSDEIHFIKTHDLPDETLSSDDDVVFYILRDGRDASLSYFRYLQTIAGQTEAALENVLIGAAGFGSWGNHVVQWHQVQSNPLHKFKFEDVIGDPDGLADQLSTFLGSERSHEPFPDIGTFRQAAPGFVGDGKTGSHEESFSELHRALFEVYSGPAMRLAGYEPGGLSDDEIAAYAIYCRQIDELRRTVAKLQAEHGLLAYEHAVLAHEHAVLGHERAVMNLELEKLNRDLAALTKKNEGLEAEAAFVREKYDRLMTYTGLSAVRWIVHKSRILHSKRED